MSLRSSMVLLTFLLAASACNNGTGPAGPDAGSGEVDAAGSGEVTYYGNIRPIFVENCVTCHTPGGIAPFALETYAQATEVGERVRDVTAARIMPPFLADNSGECQTYANYRGLTDAEIATIDDWFTMGMLEGDPTTLEPDPVVLPGLASVDATLEMPTTYGIDEAGTDDYRCFVVDTGITEPVYVTGYEVHPGNQQRVHHVIVYNPTSDAAAASADSLDAAEGAVGDGYSCFGGPRVDAVPMVLWAPGTGATRFPRGTGVELAVGRRQVIQVHYNNLVPDSPASDRTTIDLSTSPTANPAYLVPIWNLGITLPPRMESIVQSNDVDLSFLPVPVRVWGIFPHMHTLGRQLRVELNAGGASEQCMLEVPRWDFNWQLAYWYDSPVSVGPTDTATITCTYNTMERDETVTWGDGTLDEMCLAFVYATL